MTAVTSHTPVVAVISHSDIRSKTAVTCLTYDSCPLSLSDTYDSCHLSLSDTDVSCHLSRSDTYDHCHLSLSDA